MFSTEVSTVGEISFFDSEKIMNKVLETKKKKTTLVIDVQGCNVLFSYANFGFELMGVFLHGIWAAWVCFARWLLLATFCWIGFCWCNFARTFVVILKVQIGAPINM